MPARFARFDAEIIEEITVMTRSTTSERAVIFKHTRAMLPDLINENRNRLSLTQRWAVMAWGKAYQQSLERAGG